LHSDEALRKEVYPHIDFDDERTISKDLVFWGQGIYAFVDRIIDNDIESTETGILRVAQSMTVDRKAFKVSAAMILLSLDEEMVLSLIQGTFPKDYLFNPKKNAKLPPITRTPALYKNAAGQVRRPSIYGHWHVNDVTGEPPSANEYTEWLHIMRLYIQDILPSYEKVAANRKAKVDTGKLWDDVVPDDEIRKTWKGEHTDVIKLIDREVGDMDESDDLPERTGTDSQSWQSTHWHRGRRRWIGGIRQIESLDTALTHLEKRINRIPHEFRHLPIPSALAEIGYSIDPEKRLAQHAKHQSTNSLMALVRRSLCTCF